MKRIRHWLRSIGHWLRNISLWLRLTWGWFIEFGYIWIAVTVVILAIRIAVYPGASEPTIRLTGLGLQLLGILTVIWGIHQTRTLFGHPPVWSVGRDWWRRRPHLGRQGIVIEGVVTLPSVIAHGRMHQTHRAGEDATLEERVDAIEKNLIFANERINQTQQQIDAETRKTAEAIKQEQDARTTEDRAINKKLEATGTGGVSISFMGAIWLFVGVTLSTASLEISQWLK